MTFLQNIWTILLVSFWAHTISICAAEDNSEYSEKEILALKQFRARIPDVIAVDEYYQKDSYLIRWLRARNLNLNEAEEMVRAAIKWRSDNRIETVVNETLLQFSTPPYVFQGTDKEGRPLILLTPTTIDFRGLVLASKQSTALRTWDQLLERGFNYIKYNRTTLPDGKDVTQLVAICDGNGFNVRQHACLGCIPVYIDMLYHYENYYLDSLKYFIIINAHRLSLPLIEILRPFLSEATQKSLVVFDSNKAEWSSFLRKIIDQDQLPYRFGGKRRM